MDEFGKNFALFIGIVATIALIAVVSGTIIWGTWDALHYFWPTSPLPVNPNWWVCVKGAWLVSIIARLFLPNVKIEKKS